MLLVRFVLVGVRIVRKRRIPLWLRCFVPRYFRRRCPDFFIQYRRWWVGDCLSDWIGVWKRNWYLRGNCLLFEYRDSICESREFLWSWCLSSPVRRARSRQRWCRNLVIAILIVFIHFFLLVLDAGLSSNRDDPHLVAHLPFHS